MDKLKELVAAKRKAANEEFGGRKFVKPCLPTCAPSRALEAESKVKDDGEKSTADGKGCDAPDSASSGASSAAAAEIEIGAADDDAAPPWSWRQFAAFCGPGLLMSVAYLVWRKGMQPAVLPPCFWLARTAWAGHAPTRCCLPSPSPSCLLPSSAGPRQPGG